LSSKEKDNLLEEETLLEQDLLDAEPEETAEAEHELSETEQLEAKVAELEDLLLRRQAEFENYRKRTTKEKEEIGLTAKIHCVGELLPCVDNFERALMIPCSDEEYKKGIAMMFQGMKDIFAKLGVEEIKAEGEPFDPAYHYAVSTVENPDLGSNVVAAVLQKGYKIGDKVVRPAMVAVANP